MAKRIGVLGGSFNPVHLGHLHIAGEIQKLFSLSHVYFAVAGAPPHKDPGHVISLQHRYAMVSLATAGLASFLPSLVELEPPSSPFTVDTLEKLDRRARREKAILYFIAGGDSLAEVMTWRDSEKLLSTYNFIFAGRPGIQLDNPANLLPGKTAGRLRELTGLSRGRARQIINENSRGTRIYLVDVNAPDISSTRIRRLAASGQSIRKMVPGSVREYIRKLHLYGAR